jgi:hypothetical protein
LALVSLFASGNEEAFRVSFQLSRLFFKKEKGHARFKEIKGATT